MRNPGEALQAWLTGRSRGAIRQSEDSRSQEPRATVRGAHVRELRGVGPGRKRRGCCRDRAVNLHRRRESWPWCPDNKLAGVGADVQLQIRMRGIGFLRGTGRRGVDIAASGGAASSAPAVAARRSAGRKQARQASPSSTATNLPFSRKRRPFCPDAIAASGQASRRTPKWAGQGSS
jgi:hypothetical protein